MDAKQLRKIIEALLFVAEKPLSLTQLKEILEDVDVAEIKAQIEILQNEYKESGRSFNITEIAGGYRVLTDPTFAPWLSKLYHKSRGEKLTRPSLETLSIIAYRQPITRLEIEDIRGVNVEGVLNTLLEKSLVRISGRKQIPGRPFLYSTTRQFLEFFGLQSLADLPKLEEFTELAKQGEEDGKTEEITSENRPA